MSPPSDLSTQAPESERAGGLQAGALRLRHVLGQGCIANGPLASVTVALTSATAYGLGALPAAFVAASMLVLVYVNTTYQFSKHMQTAGGIYQFVRAGFADHTAFGTATAYALANLLLVAGNALIAPSLLDFAAASLGIRLPSSTWIAVSLLILLVSFGLTSLRVRPSLDYGIVTAVLEVLAVVAVAVYLVVQAGGANTLRVYDPALALHGWSGLGVAMAMAAVALGGADNVLALGEETAAPQRTIKRSVLTVQIGVIAIYLLASYAVTVGWGPGKMASFAESGSPLLVLVARVGSWLVVLLAVLALNSIIGVNVAVNISTARLLFDTARRGLLPRALARTHARYRTPVPALTVCVAVELLAAFGSAAIWGLTEGFLVVMVASTAGFVVQQLMTSAALIAFARRNRLRGPLYYVGIPGIACVLLAYSLYGNVFPISMPESLGVFILIGLSLLAGSVAALRMRQIPEPEFETR